jgi:hypothetical protein
MTKAKVLVKQIVTECETVISSVDILREEIDVDSINGIEIDDMRYLAELMQERVSDLSRGTYESINNLSIELYQEVKYTFEHIEEDYPSLVNNIVAREFQNIRDAVDTIRACVELV